MANATITFTACDNELYLVAIPAAGVAGASYELIHIQSGNNNAVNFSLTISAGTYPGVPQPLNGVNSGLTTNQSISIPTGTYNLVAVGINWGVVSNFSFYIGSNSSLAVSSSVPNSGPPQASWTPMMTSAFSVS